MNNNEISKFVVKIRSPKVNAKKAVGTGLAISKSLVITAKHVLCLEERDPAEPITVEFSELLKPDSTPVLSEPIDANIFYQDFDDLDVVVLELAEPLETAPSQNILASIFPVDKQPWSVKGFPRASRDFRQAISFSGEFELQNEHNKTLTLNNVTATLKEQEDWKGVSGAPVLSEGKVIAVITTTSDKVNNTFTATSIPWLLKNNNSFKEKYYKEIGPNAEDGEQVRRIIEKNIDYCLKSSEPLKALIHTVLAAKATAHGGNLVTTVMSLEENAWKLVRTMHNKLEAELPTDPQTDKDLQSKVSAAITLAGWLLILSVEKNLLLDCGMFHGCAEGGLGKEISLSDTNYGEVLVSRWSLSPVGFELDNYNRLFPTKRVTEELVFDHGGADEQLLRALYKDIRKLDPKKVQIADITFPKKQLIEDIRKKVFADTAHDDFLEEHQQPPAFKYYLLSEDRYKLITSASWYEALEKAVAGRLVFICCKNSTEDAGNTEQGEKLAALELLMMLRRKK